MKNGSSPTHSRILNYEGAALLFMPGLTKPTSTNLDFISRSAYKPVCPTLNKRETNLENRTISFTRSPYTSSESMAVMKFLRAKKTGIDTTGIDTMKGLGKSESGESDFGWIGRGIEVKGDIAFSEKIQVDGRVSGKLTSETGTLIVGESGRLDSQIDVAVCVVHGELHGNVIARSKLEIRKTGRIHGDVITPVLLVEEGAVFNGAIRMTQDAGGRLLEDVRLTDIDAGGRRHATGA